MRSSMSNWLLAPIAALALLAASCGGGASVSAPPGDTSGITSGNPAVPTGTANDDNSPFSGLPSIPLDTGAARTLSDAGEQQNIVVLGKDYLQMQGGTVDGDAITLSTGPAGEGERPALSYAMYQLSGLGDGRPLSLNVECLPGEFGDGYFIGIANYTQARWTWFGPVKLPEFQLDLSRNNHRFVTQLGNLYFILVCPPDTAITHSQSAVVMGAGGSGGEVPPGLGHGLRASDGGFDHQIRLDWEPGAGASGYEVWRRPAFEGSQWQQIGMAAVNHFDDNQLPNNRYFYYRVRAVNAQGPAEFSNPDFGWAGLATPRDISGVIHGGNGQTLAGVPVALAGYGPDMVHPTNAEGRYEFKGLAPGHYTVAPLPRDIDFTPNFGTADLTAQEHAQLDFTAHPAQPGSVVWGFVMTPNLAPDGSGDHLMPVAGVAMTLADVDEPGHILTTTTNEAGFYAFISLPFGPFKVSAVKEGLNILPPEVPVLLGPQNIREQRSFIALPPPPGGGGGGNGGNGGDPPPGGGDPPPGGGGNGG